MEQLKKKPIINENFIRILFVISFLSGSFVIIISAENGQVLFSIVIPILTMLIYAFIGFRKSEIFIANQFPDSLYYLGFLYTLVALAVSLWMIHESNYTLEEGLVSRFGLALATTILGLFLRILFVNFRLDVEDLKEIAEVKLSQNVERFATEIDFCTDKLQAQNRDLIDRMNTIIRQSTTHIEEAASKLNLFNAKLTEIIDKFTANMDRVNQKHLEHFEASMTYTTAQIEKVSDFSFTELSKDLKEFTSNLINSIDDFVKKLDEVLLPSNIFTSKFEKPLTIFSDRLKGFCENVDDYIKEHGSLIDKETKNFAAGCKNLNSEVFKLKNLSTEVQNHLTFLKDLIAGTNNLSESVKGAADNMSSFNELTKNSIISNKALSDQFTENLNIAQDYKNKIKTELEKSTDDLSKMYKELVKAAYFVNQKLKANIQ